MSDQSGFSKLDRNSSYEDIVGEIKEEMESLEDSKDYEKYFYPPYLSTGLFGRISNIFFFSPYDFVDTLFLNVDFNNLSVLTRIPMKALFSIVYGVLSFLHYTILTFLVFTSIYLILVVFISLPYLFSPFFLCLSVVTLLFMYFKTDFQIGRKGDTLNSCIMWRRTKLTEIFNVPLCFLICSVWSTFYTITFFLIVILFRSLSYGSYGWNDHNGFSLSLLSNVTLETTKTSMFRGTRDYYLNSYLNMNIELYHHFNEKTDNAFEMIPSNYSFEYLEGRLIRFYDLSFSFEYRTEQEEEEISSDTSRLFEKMIFYYKVGDTPFLFPFNRRIESETEEEKYSYNFLTFIIPSRILSFRQSFREHLFGRYHEFFVDRKVFANSTNSTSSSSNFIWTFQEYVSETYSPEDFPFGLHAKEYHPLIFVMNCILFAFFLYLLSEYLSIPDFSKDRRINIFTSLQLGIPLSVLQSYSYEKQYFELYIQALRDNRKEYYDEWNSRNKAINSIRRRSSHPKNRIQNQSLISNILENYIVAGRFVVGGKGQFCYFGLSVPKFTVSSVGGRKRFLMECPDTGTFLCMNEKREADSRKVFEVLEKTFRIYASARSRKRVKNLQREKEKHFFREKGRLGSARSLGILFSPDYHFEPLLCLVVSFVPSNFVFSNILVLSKHVHQTLVNRHVYSYIVVSWNRFRKRKSIFSDLKYFDNEWFERTVPNLRAHSVALPTEIFSTSGWKSTNVDNNNNNNNNAATNLDLQNWGLHRFNTLFSCLSYLILCSEKEGQRDIIESSRSRRLNNDMNVVFPSYSFDDVFSLLNHIPTLSHFYICGDFNVSREQNMVELKHHPNLNTLQISPTTNLIFFQHEISAIEKFAIRVYEKCPELVVFELPYLPNCFIPTETEPLLTRSEMIVQSNEEKSSPLMEYLEELKQGLIRSSTKKIGRKNESVFRVRVRIGEVTYVRFVEEIETQESRSTKRYLLVNGVPLGVCFGFERDMNHGSLKTTISISNPCVNFSAFATGIRYDKVVRLTKLPTSVADSQRILLSGKRISKSDISGIFRRRFDYYGDRRVSESGVYLDIDLGGYITPEDFVHNVEEREKSLVYDQKYGASIRKKVFEEQNLLHQRDSISLFLEKRREKYFKLFDGLLGFKIESLVGSEKQKSCEDEDTKRRRNRMLRIRRTFSGDFLLPMRCELEVKFLGSSGDDGENSLVIHLQSSVQLMRKNSRFSLSYMIPEEQDEKKFEVSITLEIVDRVISVSEWVGQNQKFVIEYHSKYFDPIQNIFKPRREEKQLVLEISNPFTECHRNNLFEETDSDFPTTTFQLCGIDFAIGFFPFKCSLLFQRYFPDHYMVKISGLFRVQVLDENESKVIETMEMEMSGNKTFLKGICNTNLERRVWKFMVRFEVFSVEWSKQ